ncbi:hypothetical protein CHUAL_007951 [Chamberlinius hualienensis]
MSLYVWLLVALGIFGCANALPVETEVNEVVKAVLQYKLMKEQIPNSVYDQIREIHANRQISLVVPKEAIQRRFKLNAIDPNAVLDELLREVNADVKASGLDPYVLADISIFGLTVSLTVGGFDTLHRVGDAVMTVFDEYNVKFDATVQVYSLTGDFAFSFTFLGLTYNAGADAMVDTVDADSEFTVSVNPANNATYIHDEYLDSSNIGRITVEVYGLGPLDPFANIIADMFLNIFKGFIPIFFDGIFLDIVNQVLNDLYPPWQ